MEICWQKKIRDTNLESDTLEACKVLGVTSLDNLTISDFDFSYEPKEVCFQDAKAFIEKHEWLGRMSLYPTHIFTARYKGLLSGVVVMDMPPTFSKLLGEDTRKIERIISRGACISWSPSGLASSLIMFGIRWMVQNTRFRLFGAYSDTEASELGTIYQACNFYYIGRTSGASFQYKLDSDRWVSDRYFRSRAFYKKTAKRIGVEWQSDWQRDSVVFFDRMPEEIASSIKSESKLAMQELPKRKVPPKHKYVYVLGDSKKETKFLRRLFEERNHKIIKPYPKVRGE